MNVFKPRTHQTGDAIYSTANQRYTYNHELDGRSIRGRSRMDGPVANNTLVKGARS